VNVTKTFTDMKQIERSNEREAFLLARKLRKYSGHTEIQPHDMVVLITIFSFFFGYPYTKAQPWGLWSNGESAHVPGLPHTKLGNHPYTIYIYRRFQVKHRASIEWKIPNHFLCSSTCNALTVPD
jgi:hypothetical protein